MMLIFTFKAFEIKNQRISQVNESYANEIQAQKGLLQELGFSSSLE